jgi:hypothetical protein
MNISELFIKRPVATILVMFGILLAGGMGYRLLPVADLPTVDFPTVSVTATLSGASPETMAAGKDTGRIKTAHPPACRANKLSARAPREQIALAARVIERIRFLLLNASSCGGVFQDCGAPLTAGSSSSFLLKPSSSGVGT